MLPQKIFQNLRTDTVMAILVLQQFLRQILFRFLTLISPSLTMTHFVHTFSIYACLRRKDYCYIEEVRNYGKFKEKFIKNIIENGW